MKAACVKKAFCNPPVTAACAAAENVRQIIQAGGTIPDDLAKAWIDAQIACDERYVADSNELAAKLVAEMRRRGL